MLSHDISNKTPQAGIIQYSVTVFWCSSDQRWQQQLAARACFSGTCMASYRATPVVPVRTCWVIKPCDTAAALDCWRDVMCVLSLSFLFFFQQIVSLLACLLSFSQSRNDYSRLVFLPLDQIPASGSFRPEPRIRPKSCFVQYDTGQHATLTGRWRR